MYLLKMLAITAGSDVTLPFESLSLLITLTLLDFRTLITDLIPVLFHVIIISLKIVVEITGLTFSQGF